MVFKVFQPGSIKKEKVAIIEIIAIPPPSATGLEWLDLLLGISTNPIFKKKFFNKKVRNSTDKNDNEKIK